MYSQIIDSIWVRIFTKLNWIVFSTLVTLDKGYIKWVAEIPLSIIISRTFSFKFSNVWLLLSGVSVMVFVLSRNISFIVSVSGLNTFFKFSLKFYLPNLSFSRNSLSWFCNKANLFKFSYSCLVVVEFMVGGCQLLLEP